MIKGSDATHAGRGAPGDAGDEGEGDLEARIGLPAGRAARDPGLGLLLELARRGEYDPWDIDIVALTDRYLAALDERLDARDLGHVGRLIFYAAALIHLKAQALAERERRRDGADEQAAFDAELDELADALRRRRGLLPDDAPLVYPDGFEDDGVGGLAPRERRPRARGLTLRDLIDALRDYDERLATREAELADVPVFDEATALEECIGSAHQDDLDRDIVLVREDLWRLLAGEREQVELEELVGAGRTRGGAYLALLFLANDEEVVLAQQAVYGPLTIRRGRFFGEVRAGVRQDDEDAPESGAAPETELEAEAEAEASWSGSFTRSGAAEAAERADDEEEGQP